MIVFAVIFVLWLCFHIYTLRFVNIYRLYMLFGGKGSGKSSYLVKTAYRHLRRGWVVYTNMEELSLPGLRHIDIHHVGDFVPVAHSVLLLDEVGMVWDNRDYKLFKRPVRDFFKLQRHYLVKVYLASQKFDIDKKLRDLTDGMYLCRCFYRVFSVGQKIRIKPKVVQASGESEARITDDLVVCPIIDWSFTFIPRWAKYFDSHAVPPHDFLPYSEPVPYDATFYSLRKRLTASLSHAGSPSDGAPTKCVVNSVVSRFKKNKTTEAPFSRK